MRSNHYAFVTVTHEICFFFCIFTTYIKQWHGEVNEVWSKLSFNVVQSQFEIAILFLNASFHLKYFFSKSFVSLIFLELNCSMNLNFIIVFNILNFIPVRKAAQTFFSRKKQTFLSLNFDWIGLTIQGQTIQTSTLCHKRLTSAVLWRWTSYLGQKISHHWNPSSTTSPPPPFLQLVTHGSKLAWLTWL